MAAKDYRDDAQTKDEQAETERVRRLVLAPHAIVIGHDGLK